MKNFKKFYLIKIKMVKILINQLQKNSEGIKEMISLIQFQIVLWKKIEKPWKKKDIKNKLIMKLLVLIILNKIKRDIIIIIITETEEEITIIIITNKIKITIIIIIIIIEEVICKGTLNNIHKVIIINMDIHHNNNNNNFILNNNNNNIEIKICNNNNIIKTTNINNNLTKIMGIINIIECINLNNLIKIIMDNIIINHLNKEVDKIINKIKDKNNINKKAKLNNNQLSLTMNLPKNQLNNKNLQFKN
jgi:hypothetical protein